MRLYSEDDGITKIPADQCGPRVFSLIYGCWDVSLYLRGVVGSFLSDINIVGVALLETCSGDSYELSLFVKGGDVHAAAVAHT